MVQRCTKCLLPDTYPSIEFDAEGVCNECRAFKKKELLGESALIDLLGSQKGERYDCLLGISGGKDSCYVAYLTKKRLNLRALAVCYDFPFLCDLARRNIEVVCKSLDIELLVIKSKGDLEYRFVRNHFLSVASTSTTWGQCMFCHYGIEGVLYNVAVERKIPFILGGITKYELWDPGSRTGFLLHRIKKLPVKEVAKFFFYQSKAYSLLVDQRRQFKIPGNSVLDVYRRAKLPQNGPRSIDVFDYMRWDQRVIEKTLREETGWAKPDKSLSWRYDCSLEPFLDYTYKKEFGISTVGIYLSNLIRDGLMSREEALKALELSEDEKMLREKLESVFEFLKLPALLRKQFFDGASSR